MKPIFIRLTMLAASLLTFNGFSQDPDFHIYLAFGQSNYYLGHYRG